MTAADLTPRERAVLTAFLAGQRGPDIAREQQRTHGAIKSTMRMLRLKAGVRNLVQLGAWAERHGIREATPG